MSEMNGTAVMEQPVEAVAVPAEAVEEVAIEVKVFGTADEAKADAEAQNAKLPSVPEGTRQAKATVYVGKLPGKDSVYTVASSASRARDAISRHFGLVVDLQEPKRKPKATLADLFELNGGNLSGDELARVRAMLDKLDPPKKGRSGK